MSVPETGRRVPARPLRLLSRCLVACAVGLFACSGYLFWCSTSGGGATPAAPTGLVIVNTDHVFKAPVASGLHQITFEAHNPTGGVIRVLGAAELCGGGICPVSAKNLPLDIPPGESRSIQLECGVITPESCYLSVPIHYQCEGGLGIVHVTISGGRREPPSAD